MNEDLIQRRTDVAARHDRALNRWPRRDDPRFDRELEEVIAELRSIIEENQGEDSAEAAKTWQYLGMALYDYGMGYPNYGRAFKEEFLRESLNAYQRALDHLKGGIDPSIRAKTQFNMGNTFRGLWKFDGSSALDRADACYMEALEFFDKFEPDYSSVVRTQLKSLGSERMVQSRMDQVTGISSEFQALQDSMRGLTGDASISAQDILRQFNDLKDRASDVQAGIAGIWTLAQSQLEERGEHIPKERKAAIKSMLAKSKKFRRKMRAAGSDGTDVFIASLLTIMRQRYESDKAENKIPVQRQRTLEGVFDEIKELFDQRPDGLERQAEWIAKLRAYAERLISLMRTPSTGVTLLPGSRAESIHQLWSSVMQELSIEMNSPLGPEEQSAVTSLYIKMAQEITTIHETTDDDSETVRLEGERLRGIMVEVRDFAYRHNIMVAMPKWGLPALPKAPDGVFVDVGNAFADTIESLLEARKLKFIRPTMGGAVAQERWNAIYSAALVIIELVDDEARRCERAVSYYQLGVARALGKPAVVISQMPKEVAFDVDLLVADGSRENLGDRIDEALYSYPHPQIRDQGYLATVEFVGQQVLEGKADDLATKKMLEIARKSKDSLEARLRLESLTRLFHDRKPLYLLPPFPPQYPTGRRCFHVMPFRPDWANKVSRVVKETCGLTIEYQRGDLDRTRDIIRSIWNGIAGASHVVIDLTGLNRNVLYELGLCDVLGRNSVLVMEEKEFKTEAWEQIYLLARDRLTPYVLRGSGAKSLKAIIRDFLSL